MRDIEQRFRHCEVETRFVPAFAHGVLPRNTLYREGEGPNEGSAISVAGCACLFDSTTTEVFPIHTRNSIVRDHGCLHMMGSKLIDIDAALTWFGAAGLTGRDAAEIYVAAGCDSFDADAGCRPRIIRSTGC